MDCPGYVLRAAHTDSTGDAAVAPYGRVLLHAMLEMTEKMAWLFRRVGTRA